MNHPTSIRDTVPVLLEGLRRFAPQVRPHRWILAGAVGGLLAEVVLRLAEPWVLKVVFDVLVTPPPGGPVTAFRWLESWGREPAVALLAVLVVAIAGLRALASYRSTIGFARAGSAVLTDVRSDLFRHLQCLSLAFHHRSRQGDLVMRVINDVGLLQDVLVTAIVPLIARTLVLAGMALLMFVMEPRLALLAAAVVPLFWLRGRRLSRRIHEVARKQRRREGELAATAAESFGATSVVQALSLGERFADNFRRRNDRAVKEDVRGKRLAARLERSVDLCIALATALVLWRGTHLVWEGVLTPGDLLVFLAYLKTAFRPLQDTAKYTGRLAKAAAATERVLALLREQPGVRNLPGARPAEEFRGELTFDRVTFHHADSPAAGGRPGPGNSSAPNPPGITEMSFVIRPGTFAAIVGASGCGKSTLLGLVPRLYDPIQGAVRIDGTDLREFTLESLRSRVAFVLQDTGLFAASVRDNLAAGASDVTDADLEAAARLAGAHEFIVELPDGYDTVIGERGVTLSQGQRQRLAIARAALRRSPILLLDEPTNGLDQPTARAVFRALRRLAVGRTTLLVTHDPTQADAADVVLLLDQGRLVEFGPPAQLRSLGGRYAALRAGTSTHDQPLRHALAH